MLPQGEIGVLEVKGPNVFKGYWRMPEKTAAEFRADGFFITGDVSRIDERGYISIVGRAKDLIICGGLNVYPKEVEGEIDALPGVEKSAVIGVPHADLGEGVVAVVVAAPRRARPARRRSSPSCKRPPRRLQDAQAGRHRRRAAPQHHGQGPEEPAERSVPFASDRLIRRSEH